MKFLKYLIAVMVIFLVGCATYQTIENVEVNSDSDSAEITKEEVEVNSEGGGIEIAEEGVEVNSDPEDIEITEEDVEAENEISQSSADWQNTKLTDVRTGDEFAISDFRGKKVFVEGFAVWCPTCTKQQGEIKKLHDEIGDEVISISLNIDPNEDDAKILGHVQSNGFNWLYAVSPTDLTQALIDEYGVSFASAPSAPVALICEDGSSRYLRSGVKNVDDLINELAAGC